MANSEADKKKLILAVVLLVLAGLVIAWNLGLFSGGSSTPTPAPVAAPDGAPQGGGARSAK
ncbi:MAG: hypothetical protein HEQ23_14530 [Tepidisphaera sp.]|jgi:hypothetical protein